jgi:hypothetical protein
MSVLLKCPDNHQNPLPLGRITCAYCKQFGVPVDTSIDKNTIVKEYNSLVDKIEDNLIKLKTIPEPSTAKLFFIRLLNIISLGLFYVLTKSSLDKNSYKFIEADAERNKRLLENKFGEEEKVKDLIKDVNNQLKTIRDKQRKKQTEASIFSFGLIIGLIIFVLLIFASPFSETEEYLTENENIELINEQIENKIIDGKYNEAKQTAGKLKFNKKTEALRKIQIAYLDSELEKIRELIKKGDHNEAEIYLTKLNWEPVENPKFDEREKELINFFETKKQAIYALIIKDK